MLRLERLRDDWTILRQMLRGMPRSASHAADLQAFYAPQADGYDRFRARLLHGRAELIESLPLPRDATVVELGGGTGANAEFFGARLESIARLDIVDLCPALLAQARARLAGYRNVEVVSADAATYRPSRPVDCVYFSYSLSMMRDWRAALANALTMLKPHGVLGVVDFYHSGPRPSAGLRRHGPLARAFWRHWFAHDGVRLDPAHLGALRAWLPEHTLREHAAAVPYVPLLRVPYYIFVGRKPLRD